MPPVPDELLVVLTRFHREVLLPDLQRLETRLDERIDARFDEFNGHFDAIYQRFDRLETEYHMLVAAVGRIEARLDRVEQHRTG